MEDKFDVHYCGSRLAGSAAAYAWCRGDEVS